jgi:outer membrane protein TolC
MLPRKLLVLLSVVLSSTLVGCAQMRAIEPKPLSSQDILALAKQDAAAVRAGVPAVGARLTLDEAIARALKYNLDRRVRLMEEALALRQFEAGKFDILPRLVASAGYAARDKDRLSVSLDANGRPTGANPTASQERNRELGGLELTWSLLDFGLARYNSEQSADRLLAASERRRKSTHQLIQDVRVAYWRAASAQRLQQRVRDNVKLAEEALADARTTEVERLRSAIDILRYQRQLTENLRLLESIDQELATARFELSALINAPVVTKIELAADQELPSGDLLSTAAETMEQVALSQNADLREWVYSRRIAATEARRVIAQAFPNVSFNIGGRHDSDRYLVNSGWAEAGLQVSYNLFNLLALPAQQRAAAAGVVLADQRRLAAHVAVVTQVHVAREQLLGARRQFERADALWLLDDKITRQMAGREQAQAGSKLERVAAQTSAIVSLMRRYQALAQVHAAHSRLLATLGFDPLEGSTDDLTLEQVTEQVRRGLAREVNFRP